MGAAKDRKRWLDNGYALVQLLHPWELIGVHELERGAADEFVWFETCIIRTVKITCVIVDEKIKRRCVPRRSVTDSVMKSHLACGCGGDVRTREGPGVR